MNRIFNHKYNHNGDIVVVSELAIKNAKKKKVICLAILSFFPLVVLASDVGNILPYQAYRDFSENKGEFSPGATNIPLYNKNGTLVPFE